MLMNLVSANQVLFCGVGGAQDMKKMLYHLWWENMNGLKIQGGLVG